ncbi:MAG: hypothetical protein LBC27_03295 [Spirochaetaceae bacterium]|jgi:hypothetical protein|nr:hypothetical protein [Spirochaetaceae bacterium]
MPIRYLNVFEHGFLDEFVSSCVKWQVEDIEFLRKDGFTAVEGVYVLSDEVVQKINAKLDAYSLAFGDVWNVRINNNRAGMEIFLRIVDTTNTVWDFYALRFNFN